MLQEAVDERFCTQGTTLFCASLGGAIATRQAVIVQLEETVVAQGHPENIRGQILQRIPTRAYRFTVRDPRLLPNVCRDPCIPGSATQSLPEFATENPAERSHGQEEIVSCREPTLPIRTQTSARDQVMHMRMVRQVAAP